MKDSCRKLCVGIDIHRYGHKAALITKVLLEQPSGHWKKVNPPSIKNNSTDFRTLDNVIGTYIWDADEVALTKNWGVV